MSRLECNETLKQAIDSKDIWSLGLALIFRNYITNLLNHECRLRSGDAWKLLIRVTWNGDQWENVNSSRLCRRSAMYESSGLQSTQYYGAWQASFLKIEIVSVPTDGFTWFSVCTTECKALDRWRLSGVIFSTLLGVKLFEFRVSIGLTIDNCGKWVNSRALFYCIKGGKSINRSLLITSYATYHNLQTDM